MSDDLGLAFGTLHEAVDRLVATFTRYHLLLTHRLGHMDEVITEPWEYAFTVPWMPDGRRT